MNELPLPKGNELILINTGGKWINVEPLNFGEVLIKIHNGEIKQVETTKKEKY